MNYIITNENLDKEKESLGQIKKNLEEFHSFYLDAGAGSGKTYTLVKSISFVLSKYQSMFKSYRQKILCITYTNVAADEIKDRVGSSEFIEVSTIHRFLSDMIMNFQEDLRDIHLEKLKYECHKLFFQTALPECIYQMEIEKCIDRDRLENIKQIKWAKKKYEKPEFISEMARLKDKIFSEDDVDKYLKEDYGIIKKEFHTISSSKSNFDAYLKKLIKIKKYKKIILDGISKKIEYTSDFNYDMLENMCISHDTLLEYCYQLFKRNDIVKQLLFDSYPIIFIDEYQDTSQYVIQLIQLVEEYCYLRNKKFLVGYFGDVKQSIYDNGVGRYFQELYRNKISDEIIEGKITRVKKEFNRRSSNEIIQLANKIRSDDLEQQSIYNDFIGERVIYSNKSFEEVKNELLRKWNIDYNNPLDCLVLNRKTIAIDAGFNSIFDIYNKTYYFYNDKDVLFNREKLSLVSKALYKITLIFRKSISGEEFLIGTLFDLSEFNKQNGLSQKALRKVVQVLREKHNDLESITLEGYLKLLFDVPDKIFSESEKQIYKSLFKFGNDRTIFEYESFIEYLLKYFNLKDDRYIKELLVIDMREFVNWSDYIDESSREIIFHTYHGSKGEEYDNVLIVLEDTFGPNNNLKHFNKLFKFLNGEFNDIVDEEIISLQNLLYVAVTRAKRNLCILYTGRDEGLKLGVSKFYGENFSSLG
ncbi:TPA: UvrD-helicase domain-containing protein [Streptococcus suis]